MTNPPASWYPDPTNPNQQRYWDGAQWTEHTQPAAQAHGGFAPPVVGAVSTQKPDTYLVWAILATLFCCLPFGIVSIINAAKVDSAWAQGQYQEAVARSQAAKKWAIISAASVAVIFVIYVIAMVVLGVSFSATDASV
jgi:hypothetical protein